MNAVTFGVYSAIMKKFGYKMEDMEYDTLENLQKTFEGGVCKVKSFAFVQQMTFVTSGRSTDPGPLERGVRRQETFNFGDRRAKHHHNPGAAHLLHLLHKDVSGADALGLY